jgi:hypothetical protein
MYNDVQLLPWLDAVREAAGGFELFDAHVHFGISDPSGLLATEEEALEALALIDSGGLLFPLKEPDGYRGPNERALALARDSDGRIAALARLDPADDPTGEARRCLDAGAAGIKLHPRGEGFELADPRLDGALALADERRAIVMLHAGHGFDGLGRQALDRARDHPGARFVLAHCAISDLSWIHEPAAELPNVFFDTSWWNPSDLYALFRLVPPSRILYASDVPFASPVQSAVTTARIALEAGLDERQMRSVMGGQLARLAAAEEPLDVGSMEGEARPLPVLLERVYVMLIAAVEGLLRGEDAGQGLELARNGCKVADDHELEPILAAIDDLLEHSEQTEDRDPLRHGRAPGYDLVLTAAIAARTPSVPVPVARTASA